MPRGLKIWKYIFDVQEIIFFVQIESFIIQYIKNALQAYNVFTILWCACF